MKRVHLTYFDLIVSRRNVIITERGILLFQRDIIDQVLIEFDFFFAVWGEHLGLCVISAGQMFNVLFLALAVPREYCDCSESTISHGTSFYCTMIWLADTPCACGLKKICWTRVGLPCHRYFVSNIDGIRSKIEVPRDVRNSKGP